MTTWSRRLSLSPPCASTASFCWKTSFRRLLALSVHSSSTLHSSSPLHLAYNVLYSCFSIAMPTFADLILLFCFLLSFHPFLLPPLQFSPHPTRIVSDLLTTFKLFVPLVSLHLLDWSLTFSLPSFPASRAISFHRADWLSILTQYGLSFTLLSQSLRQHMFVQGQLSVEALEASIVTQVALG